MRVFLTYLWKEWRDHRTVLVGMAVAVPLLLTVMGLAAPRRDLDAAQRSGFAAFVSVACLALFVISLATDLVPGETRRGHRWFLERLPGGLGAAFRGKLALFVVGGALFALYGYVVAAVMCRLLAGGWPSLPTPGSTTALIAVAALWTFAVSCALPRGALSLPAVAALALLLALPALGLWMLFPSRGPAAWWRWESGALWAAGAVVAAWVAFRRRGFLRAGRACLVVGAVCATPYWADAAHDAWDWHRHSVMAIEQAFLGEGGRFAFVNRGRHAVAGGSPVAPVIVDLRDGSERVVGTKLCRFDSFGWAPPYEVPYRFATLWDVARNDGTYFDTRSAKERGAMTEEECNAARRERPVWRFADGRIAWFNGARLTIGDVEVPELRHGCYPCGLGLESGTPNGYYDFGRERYFASRALGLRGERVWIRPGAWLTRKREDYRLFDPDTKAFAPALGFAGEDEVCAILDDGRVAAFRRGEGMLLVAPETGDLTRLAMPPGFEGGGALERFRAPARTPGGRRVFMLCKDGRIESPPTPYLSAYARLDGDALVATAAVEASISLLGCPTDDTVLVHDGRAIYRLRFGSDVKEEIWRVR